MSSGCETLSIELHRAKFKIRFDMHDDFQAWMCRLAKESIVWERDTSFCISDILQPGDCFVDLGANIGWFTLLAASIVGPEGRVLAYEPVEANYDALLDNVVLNGFQDRVTCVQKAVGDADGYLKFWLNADNSGGGAFWDVGIHPEGLKSRKNPRTITVQVTTLDGIMDTFRRKYPDMPVRCIKMDVEGAEVMVFRGGERWFRSGQTPYVFAEMNFSALEVMGYSTEQMFTVMQDYGYQAYYTPEALELMQKISVYNLLYSNLDLECLGANNAGKDSKDQGEQVHGEHTWRDEGKGYYIEEGKSARATA